MQSVTIICDGSSRLINQRRMAAAAAILISDNRNGPSKFKLISQALGEATNQQAEIKAASLALRQLKTPCKVRIMTDSRYVVETMKGNFSKKANLALWNELEEVAKRHQIKWEWIKGHSNESDMLCKLQNLVDRVASKVAEKQNFSPELKSKSEEKISEILRVNED